MIMGRGDPLKHEKLRAKSHKVFRFFNLELDSRPKKHCKKILCVCAVKSENDGNMIKSNEITVEMSDPK